MKRQRNRRPGSYGSAGELEAAFRRVLSRFDTLGACHYCEYPITRMFHGTSGELVATCELCFGLIDDGPMHRYFEFEEPLSSI